VSGTFTQSCGCLKAIVTSAKNKKHGMFGTKEYSSYHRMKDRCFDKKNKDYKNYGARGITICDRWLNSFENFYADMGNKPTPKHSIDRIDNDGNYEPSNCRWASNIQQARNKRNNRKITINGVTKIISEWADVYGINGSTIRQRINLGWSEVDAVTKPVIFAGVSR